MSPTLVFCLALVLILALPQSPFTRVALSATTGGSTVTWTDPHQLVEHRIPGNNSEPWAITTDPRGNVWFVEQGTNQLGMYDPSTGAFTQHSIPTPRSTPDSVASDSAGNIWFSELTSNNIGELPMGGTGIQEHHVPPFLVIVRGTAEPVDCGPGAVLPDPSGSIWVACLFSSQIDEYFPANGTFARFDLPVFDSAPAGILLDGRGNLWFTAADAQMLGKAVISQLRNGTTTGITEFAPLNATYPFKFTHPTSFFNTSGVVTSSLPTPSGISIDVLGRLWVTEHVDSSFDSYDPATGSLVKYWTSQTNGAYGFPVSFPNGIAVGADGGVWVGEHYGNRIAELDPSSGLMAEYPVPCCGSNIAGVYSVAMDRNGTLWFVEIGGDAIGEVVRTSTPYHLSLSIPGTAYQVGSDGTVKIPLDYSSPQQGTARLGLSGISGTGAPRNLSATFDPAEVSLSNGGSGSANLTLSLNGLNPGTYYLTLTAYASPRNVLYSVVLRLSVTSEGIPSLLYALPAVGALVAVAVLVSWRLSRRPRSRSAVKPPSS